MEFFKPPSFKLVPLFKLPGYMPPFPFFTSDSRVFHIVLMGGREIPHPVGGNGKICWGDFFIGCWDIEEWFWPFKLFSKLKYKRFSKPKYTELPGVLPLAAPFPPAGSTGGGLQCPADPLLISSCLWHKKRPLAFYKLNLEHKSGGMTKCLEKTLEGTPPSTPVGKTLGNGPCLKSV